MRKDYKKLLEELKDKCDALGTERYYVVKEWADELCSWLTTLTIKDENKYTYLKMDNQYFAVKDFHNGVIKCGGRKVYDRWEPIGVAGGVWLTCVRFDADGDVLNDIRTGEYIVYPGLEFEEVTKEEFDSAYDAVIEKICKLTSENIKYQYENYCSYFEDHKEDYPEYLDREDIKTMLKEIDNLWREYDEE